MIIFGGIYEITKELDDLLVYDFRTNKWVTIFYECASPLKLRNSNNSPDASPSSKVSKT